MSRTIMHYIMAITAISVFSMMSHTNALEGKNNILTRLPENEVIYFVLPDRFENGDVENDRGGISGDRLTHGFDPTHKGFYHGGDLEGLRSQLDYIQDLGATAIWLGPIYKNKPVQGIAGHESAGYHGYWITDFNSVDPHFGNEEDLKALIEDAHSRGIKVFLDIITNHTADVIAYRECHDPTYTGQDKTTDCPYRRKADFPYSTRGAIDGETINSDFLGDQSPFLTEENFFNLKRSDFAYTPYIPAGQETIKSPDWLNNPIYYHNRSDSTWKGESVTYGDFLGLDDLFTEHPRVVSGMIDIYKDWITKYKVDGFRVDTAKHVNPEFWRTFIPAILDHALEQGIPNFYIFAESAWPGMPQEMARTTQVDGFPFTLDFAFQATVEKVVAKGEPAALFSELFRVDDLYVDGEDTARKLPVFIGNHDMGRFSTMIKDNNPGITESEILSRVELAHAMMFFLRGAPVIYSGDEQGFIGDGNDQDAREDMFASKVASYNDNNLLGTDQTTATSNFNRKHPLYIAISNMARLHKNNAALRYGRQLIRLAEDEGGLFAISRVHEKKGEIFVAFNASPTTRRLHVDVDARSNTWQSLHGDCAKSSSAVASMPINIPAWGYVVCKSNRWTQQ